MATRSKRRSVTVSRAFRPDIQGLRAVAVVVVILDHLLGWPGGGFIGVDVFFVISGFLITGLLLREYEKTGRVSWVDFYRRRVKRIMPAALLVLLVTTVVSFVLFRVGRASSILADGIWATFFASNWRFAIGGTDYWQADGPVSPLQHFWSLAVEEQFYIVWPVLMIFVFTICARRWKGAHAKPVLFAAMLAVAAASFAWAMFETITNPTFAYFSTFSRAWELAVGALIAVATPMVSKLPQAVRPVMSYVGLAGIAVSLFLINSTSAFPAPWALLPVISSALIIAAGVGGKPFAMPALDNPVSVYVGKISYSLYLWHFPVIILLAAILPEKSVLYYLLCAGLMTYLSIAAFHLVEDPVRRSGWLEPKDKRRKIRDQNKANRPRVAGTFLGFPGIGVLALVAIPAIALTGVALVPAAPPPSVVANPVSLPATGDPSSTPEPTVASVGPAAAALTGEIDTSLQAVDWPDLAPSTLDDSTPDWPSDEYGGCAVKKYSNPDGCVFGPEDATQSIVVLGDSLGARLVYQLRQAFPTHKIYGFVRSGCISIATDMTPRSADDAAGCLADRASAIEETNALSPDYVFIINNSGGVRELASKATGADASAEWGAALTATLSELTVPAANVVVVAPPPEGKVLSECATNTSRPAACTSPMSPEWKLTSTAESAAAEALGAKYIDSHLWYCSDSGSCPSFVGTTLVKRDSVHPMAPFLDKIAPVFAEALAAKGITVG